MGGFGSAIGDVAGKLAKVASEHLNAAEAVLKKTDEGNWINDRRLNIYEPVKAQVKEKLMKSELLSRTDPATGKLRPGLAPIDTEKIHSDASKAARQAFLGTKDSFGVTAAQSIEKKHGLAAAQSFSNAVAFMLKDYVDPTTAKNLSVATKKRVGGTPFSSFKENVRAADVNIKTNPSYIPSDEVERSVHKGIYGTFSPLMVVPHIGTVFNLALGSDPFTFLSGLSKALIKGTTKGIDQMEAMVVSGNFVETHMDAIRQYNNTMATGATITNPVAKFLYTKLYRPGFQPLRDYNLLAAAGIGKSLAEQLGRDIINKGPNPKLIWQAKELGVDVQDIINQGGILDQEQLGRAMFKFTNEHIFLDNQMRRSMFLQSTWQGRLLGTYHGYVTRQQQLMRRSLQRGYQQYGPLGVVKNLAIMGTVMPIVGEGIKLLQQTYRGQPAGDTLKADIENIEGKHGADAFLGTYLDAHSHMGAFGVYGHVLRGSQIHSLVQTLSGPLISSAADLAQDTGSAIAKDYKQRKNLRLKEMQKHWKPVERDLMFDVPGISLLAQFLAHRVTPNAKDNPRHDPVRQLYHHVRGEDSYGNPIEDTDKK